MQTTTYVLFFILSASVLGIVALVYQIQHACFVASAEAHVERVFDALLQDYAAVVVQGWKHEFKQLAEAKLKTRDWRYEDLLFRALVFIENKRDA